MRLALNPWSGLIRAIPPVWAPTPPTTCPVNSTVSRYTHAVTANIILLCSGTPQPARPLKVFVKTNKSVVAASSTDT